ncbi:hypothetical protein GCM10011409_24550 [Lentibacillus populi]|uniref:Uncharacterized protein n=1 Tax=Lentibacillus populi TaxID=1827502 RepID=A0A9W5TYD6_9BACI|nr:hypothetical protein GCM10011409_24550 [Lentibacillus populi]
MPTEDIRVSSVFISLCLFLVSMFIITRKNDLQTKNMLLYVCTFLTATIKLGNGF